MATHNLTSDTTDPDNFIYKETALKDTYLAANRSPSGVTVSVSAPGKIILHGEHSVVYGKLALAASLGLRTRLTLFELESSVTEPNYIQINLQALNLLHSYDLNEVKKTLLDTPLPLYKNPSNFSWEKPEMLNHDALLQRVNDFIERKSGTHPLNLYQQLALSSLFYLFTGILSTVNISLQPFQLNIQTELSISAGTGSSASYLVTVAAAFIQYLKIKLHNTGVKETSRNGYKASRVSDLVLKNFDKRELELISKWAHCAERIIHGSASGIDNTICTFGSMVEFRKGTQPKIVEFQYKLKVLLINTMVSRDTKSLVTNVATLRDNHSVIVDGILETMDAIAQSALVYLTKITNINTPSKVEDKLQNCYEKLGELTDINQNLLRALKVSHPKLDMICSILASAGLHGKLTGAGGGGYAIALVPPYYSDIKLKDVTSNLNSHGFQVIITDLGGPGVTIDS